MCSTFTSSCMVHLDLYVTHVTCHPEKMLVYFWGQCSNICELDYHILQIEIQNATKTRADIAVDEFCFAEDACHGLWHRGKVLRKHEELYEVFLIDVGMVLTVDAGHIAPASENLFQLPPKVVCGIFANIVPVRRIWSPMAVKYFASLPQSQVNGFVEDISMNQIILLDVPNVNQKLLDLGLAKIFDSSTFHFLLETSEDLLLCPGSENAKIENINERCWRPMLNKSIILSPSFQHMREMFGPSLQTGVIESVRITCALGLHKFYCQLKRLTSEIEGMTTDMHCYYENKEKELHDEHIDNFGALCAAKGKDGKWHRGVVKQLLTSGQVEVWFMDYGSTAFVFPCHIKKLMPVFFMLPVMSFPCTLTGLASKTKHWIRLQIETFKQSLFEERINICIDSYSCIEHLYYVTLCNPQNINIHRMPGTFSEGNLKTESISKEEGKNVASGQFGKLLGVKKRETEKLASNLVHYNLRSAEMKVNVSYIGYVEYVINPSDFWIRTSEYNQEFECLMNSIEDYYSKIGISEKLIQKPASGLFCCARFSKDLNYYRAVITEVLDRYLKVFFVDFGNVEVVEFTDVKSLLPQYTHLPALAMNCSTARIFPVEEVWTKDATYFFKKSVFNRELLIEVVSKQGNRYIVDVRDKECMEQSPVSTLMLEAGYADFWNVKADDNLPQQNYKLKHARGKPIKITKSEKRIYIDKNSKMSSICCTTRMKNSFPSAPPITSTWTAEPLVASPYSQQIFKLGSVLDVKVSHVNSPAEFWCQLQSKSDQLELLMRNIQLYYSTPRDAFQPEHAGCVAKYSKDGQWYRARVIQRNIPEEVTVLFVDYGIQQKMAMRQLCAINPKFLQLEGQAFRCTLNGMIWSMNQDPAVWDQVSCNTFKEFIDNMLTSGIGLKCTIFTIGLMDRKHLCNVVDLHTPDINVCHLLLDMGLATNDKSVFSFNSSFQLYTFYYSTHGIKIGSEEKVYVTHAPSLSKFYCQLDKNTVAVDKIITDVNLISKQTKGQKLDLNKSCMCLAKYFEDGQWYRALAYAVESPGHFKVFFIDYGNTEIVDKNDVIPIPLEAKELISIPMQAIKCCLHLPLQKMSDDILLFKETVKGKQLKAIVVAKKFDGQLVLDLYDGSVKISAEITEGYLDGSGTKCLDDTQLQSSNSFTPTNVVTSSEQINEQPDYLVHLIKKTKGLMSSFLRADARCMGRKNKKQNGSHKKNVCHKSGKNTASKHCLQKIVPKYTLHPAKLENACSTNNSIGTAYRDKNGLYVQKTTRIAHVIVSREMTSTTLSFPERSFAAEENAKSSFEAICKSRSPKNWFPQSFTRLVGTFDSGIWEVDAASLLEKHKKVVHATATDITSVLKDCLLNLDGWMNKMAFADMKITLANKHNASLETLLSVESGMRCLTTLNLIACGSIQPNTEYSGFATSVIDPSEFCIQLDDAFEKMIAISSLLDELPENFQALSLDSMNPGTTCLIKCAKDHQWCRVEICITSQQFVLVRAVDYGHYIIIYPSDSIRIRALPKELAEIPRLTNPCSLNGVVPAKENFWTDAAIIFFQNSLNKQNLTVIFRHQTDLFWEVDLIINNKSVAEDLAAAGHAGFLKEIVNSSTRDKLSSPEGFRVLRAPVINH
ncbi:tudor domain-containing protein 15-like [Narcine bancroftii]|uniref:tudor domain-containing protein 15-like n=1 Tax=Narcine bancroftii TaxID=1343680 RepID=UPI0038321818